MSYCSYKQVIELRANLEAEREKRSSLENDLKVSNDLLKVSSYSICYTPTI